MRAGVICLILTSALAVGSAQEVDRAAANRLLAQVQALMEGHTDRNDERQIIDLLAGCEAGQLDHVLRLLDLEQLFEDVDDRVLGPDHYQELLELLTQTRLADLSLGVRARLIRALQRGDTDSDDEAGIRNVLLGTHAEALTALKHRLELTDDYRDLLQLIYSDIDDAPLREQILAHFAKQAEDVEVPEVKVLSDIDDTIYANWKDARFPSKTVYPGVVEFYRQLDLGPGEAPGREGDLVFVTARPGDRSGVVERTTRQTLAKAGFRRAAILTGSLLNVHSDAAIAEKKLENFSRYRRLYPEYRFVWTGDSGQGDAHFGEAMRQQAPEAVLGVFIHDVVGTSAEDRADWATRGVLFFDTYAGAALAAYECDLITTEGLARVAQAAVAGLAKLEFSDDAARDARRAELAADLARVNAALPEEARVAGP